MTAALGNVHVSQCDGLVEITMSTPGDEAGWSILVTPAQWVAVVDAGEALAPVRAYRGERSREAALEAHSHAERGAA